MIAKRWLVIVVAVAQVAVLAYMAGEREWIARTGRVITLRTAPIDPNDPMRGEYARLDYDISIVPRALCRDGVAAWFDKPMDYRHFRDRIVYAVLEVGPDGLAGLTALTDIEPAGGVFLRGRAQQVLLDTLHVRYGIEAFFMQQGKARALEDEMRNERRGSVLNMRARVSSGGTAVLDDYSWEPLGIDVTFERAEARGDQVPPRRDLRALLVTLKNHGENPVAVVDRPAGGSFRLVRNLRWHAQGFPWVGEAGAPDKATSDDVRLLQPGGTHTARIDLGDPRWFVIPESGGTPVSLTGLTDPWSASFRVEYVPPSGDELPQLPHADLMQRRVLRSAAFTPAGAID